MESSINYEILKRLPTHRMAYSDRTALLMAHMSHLSYEEDETALKKKLEDFGFTLKKMMNDSDTSAFFAESNHEDFNVLAFTGTESLRDAITDLLFIPKKFKSKTFHSGFLNAFRRVEKDVIEHCENSNKPIIVTGHSLGGALAIIACSLAIPSNKVSACYTFGAPAAGDSLFDHSIAKFPIYRVVNSLDIVARLPPWYLGSGHLTFLTPNGKRLRGQRAFSTMSMVYILLFALSIIWLPLILLSAFIFPRGSGVISGHCMANYIPKLNKIASERKDSNVQVKESFLSKYIYFLKFLVEFALYFWGIKWVWDYIKDLL